MTLRSLHRITTIFFDLDHTLFDYDAAKERAVIASFAPVLERHQVARFESLRVNYDVAMQAASAEGKMWGVSYLTPDRFRDTLTLCGLPDDGLTDLMAETYWQVFHAEPATFHDAETVLGQLEGSYRLGMITNGHPGPQRKTIAISGLAHFFEPELVIVSGEVGYHKPEAALYQEAMRRAGVTPEQSLMVGDNPTNDIDGAARAGMRTVWLARNGESYPDGLLPPDAVIGDLFGLLPLLMPGQQPGQEST
jgi:HAD superfamily hydrolase (TIGR01549 family)